MAWYRIQYRHDDCEVDPDIEWEDEWDCACNSECPACGTKDIQPFDWECVQEDEEEPDEVITYKVKTYSYCGMVFEHGEFDDLEAAVERVNIRIDYVKKLGCDVVEQAPDRWEICEPENCHMVPDFCGTLVIKEIFK